MQLPSVRLMKLRLRFVILFVVAIMAFPQKSPAPVVFKSGTGVHYSAPGEEDVSGNAQELARIGEEAAQRGNLTRAIKAYKKILSRYGHDHLAAEASFRIGQLQEQRQDYLR